MNLPRSSFMLALASLALPLLPASAATQRGAQVIQEYHHDTSPPLRDLAKSARPPQPGQIVMREHQSPKHFFEITPGPDTVAQDETTYLPQVGITRVANFDGVNGNQGGAIPPDTNGSVGLNQYVEITNFDYEVFDKSGNTLLAPTRIHNIWSGFGGQCGTQDGGDPIVLWDKMTQRWLVEQLEYFTTNEVCVAVSTTSDATGSYNRYSFPFGNSLPDYPKIGVWPDAYYLSVNSFGIGSGEPCAMDRTAMLAGQTATIQCFTPNPVNSSFLPSDFDGTTPPPSGAPNHFLELGNNTSSLIYYDFHVDFSNSANSTFTGPNTITVPTFALACGGGACVQQPNGGSFLDTLGDRLMYRLAYRNFGDHESLVVAHSVSPKSGATSTAATRWYELRATPPGGTFGLFQSGTFQNKLNNVWMASVAMDKAGNLALGASFDNATTIDPSVLFAVRTPSDPKGMLEAPVIAVKGSAVQSGSDRWGDYSSMSVDPTDDCTFWYTQEYYNQANGGAKSTDWSTHVAAFKIAGCR